MKEEINVSPLLGNVKTKIINYLSDGENVRRIRHNCIFYEMAKTNGRVICDVLGKDMIKLPGEKGFSMKEKFSDGGNKCVVEVDL